MSFSLNEDVDKKVHFIGIGGISMSGLAEILLKRGYSVSGSDAKASPITKKLEEAGAKVYIGQSADNIKDSDIVVYTAAIKEDNKELLEAKRKGLNIMDRAEFLGSLMKDHKLNVAISGTHGKTTATSMISHITLAEKVDPTILVGGELDIINGNYRVGKSDYFITEACEYKASFLKFYPYVGVILNIDADHLDFYKDIDEIEATFKKFASLIPEDGYLVGYSDDERVKRVLDGAKCNKVSYGFKSGNYTPSNIEYDNKGCASFDVLKNGTFMVHLSLKVPGKHNILNALASVASAACINIGTKSIKAGIEDFKGTHRRFENKGTKNSITVIDDYAHHPTEIKATIAAAINYPHKKIYCVFQPHTYTRTKALFKEFSEAFTGVDNLILADIYAAREKDTGMVSSKMLAEAIRKKGLDCINLHSFDAITEHLKNNAKDGDLILTIGAGDVFKIGEMFLK